MVSLDTAPNFIDGLLDFSCDEEEEDEQKKPIDLFKASNFGLYDPANPDPSFPEFEEEELEWISNKDAFPSLETFVGITYSDQKPESPAKSVVIDNHTNSTSNSTGSINGGGGVFNTLMNCCHGIRVPVKARSKRGRSRRYSQDWRWSSGGSNKQESMNKSRQSLCIGRKCMHCGAEKTPQWRGGPFGPKTLCNACGVRFKSGRLVPEYRPASSPTFSANKHSNSHRKILEMRKHKM